MVVSHLLQGNIQDPSHICVAVSEEGITVNKQREESLAAVKSREKSQDQRAHREAVSSTTHMSVSLIKNYSLKEAEVLFSGMGREGLPGASAVRMAVR
jgi:chemotaxis response regulator CheB